MAPWPRGPRAAPPPRAPPPRTPRRRAPRPERLGVALGRQASASPCAAAPRRASPRGRLRRLWPGPCAALRCSSPRACASRNASRLSASAASSASAWAFADAAARSRCLSKAAFRTFSSCSRRLAEGALTDGVSARFRTTSARASSSSPAVSSRVSKAVRMRFIKRMASLSCARTALPRSPWYGNLAKARS